MPIERAGVRGRDRCLQVAGIDDLATYRDIVKLSGGQVFDLRAAASPAQVLVASQHSRPLGLREPDRGPGEVIADLAPHRAFVVAGVLPVLVDAVLAERQRIHPVVRRRSMETKERIRMQPMTPDGLPTIDDGHLDIRLS